MARAILAILGQDLGWHDVAVAKDGQEAWDLLMTAAYNLVISDWNMPHKAGDALLAEMRQHTRTRHIPFLMMTGRATKDSILAAVKAGASDYIVKPFAKQTLVDRIRRLVGESYPTASPRPGRSQDLSPPSRAESRMDAGTREHVWEAGATHGKCSPARDQQRGVAAAPPQGSLITAVVRYCKSGQFTLPALPELACTIIAMLKDENVDVSVIEKALEADPITTATLMHVANSACYRRGGRPITTLKEAIVRLGLKQTLNQVFMIVCRGIFHAESAMFQDLLTRLWEHAIATGACARLLAGRLGLPNSDGCFLLGLLHDIGEFVLAHILFELSKERTDITEAAILSVFQGLHEEYGAILLRHWQFAEEFPQIALYHQDLSRAEPVTMALRVVHCANRVVRTLGYSLYAHDGTDLTVVESTRTLGLSAAHLEAIADETCAYVEAFKQSL
jgi:two-component system chemotaxis response regulator CheY